MTQSFDLTHASEIFPSLHIWLKAISWYLCVVATTYLIILSMLDDEIDVNVVL